MEKNAKNEKNEQYPDKKKQPERHEGPNAKPELKGRTDSGQGAPGIQGQYAGNNDTTSDAGRTAPTRPDPDTMNQNGSSHLALGKRDTREEEDPKDRKTAQ